MTFGDLMDKRSVMCLNSLNQLDPFINISYFSEIKWKPVGFTLSHLKPKHLSSSSPECPIRANVIALIIMWGGGADFIAMFTSSAWWRSNRNDSITPIRLDNDFDVGCFCLEFLIASCHHLLFSSSSLSCFLLACLHFPLHTVTTDFVFIFPQRSHTVYAL